MQRNLILFSILLIVVVIIFPAASQADEGNQKSETLAPHASAGVANRKSQIGNYCIECHTATPAHALDWARPVEWARDIPCATLRKAYEDIFQLDALTGAFANANAELRAQMTDTSALEKRFNAKRVVALNPQSNDLVALSAFSSYERAARFQMNKSYAALNETRVERGRLVILIAALSATLILLIGMVFAWRHTLKGNGIARRSRAFLPLTIFVMVGVFVAFALPIFAFAPPLPTPTEEETERQAASDQATRVSDAATRLSAQAWTLAQIGAQWHAFDKTQATVALDDARQIARAKEIQGLAYWGQTQAVRESAVAWNVSTQDLARVRADAIVYTAASPWHYRAMAFEWINVDKFKAIELLELGLANLHTERPTSNLQSDLELRAIAVTYGQFDKAKAHELVAQIDDPFVRAWGWRELGVFDRATEAARAVSSHYDRAWALREIARASDNPALLNEALDAVARIDSSDTQAYALADIAIVWAAKDAAKGWEIASKISAVNPEARVYVWRGIGNALANTDATRSKDAFGNGFTEAKKVSNPYRSEKLTAALLIDYARFNPSVALDSVLQIGDPILRDQVYLGVMPLVAAENRDKAINVAGRIASPALRVRALTEIGKVALKTGDKAQAAKNFQDAFALADKVEGTFVLRDLAIAWAETDAPAALAVVDKLEDNADKTAALQVIALQLAKTDKSASAQTFDRAINVAKSMRVFGDSFAAARALASLGSAYASVDAARANAAFALALDIAKKVNVKY
ncbi:hypothetical protein ANRL1_02616 [Anaerolineae bacterium]|nr:hypothetical protein ANRL1_02616 [Anaerolineae bacterium]